ncbi:MAG: Ger(x)C family spore germination protein [Bacillota bacterium]|jgi:spore germination protein
MRKKAISLLLLFALSLLCGGCYDRQIFENTAVIIYAGAEKGSGGKILYSFAAAENNNEKNLLVISEENDLMESAVADLTASTENPLRAGKIQNLIFSEELAKEGILNVRDANRLEVTNRFLADYAVVKGSPLTLLKILENMNSGSGVYCYLDKMLENGANAGVCPNTLRHEFNIDFETKGIDPILPLLVCDEEQNEIRIAGTALFTDDRCTGTLTKNESRFLSLMAASAETISVEMNGLRSANDKTTMNIVKCGRKIEIETAGDEVFITLRLKLRSNFDISDWTEISDTAQGDINKKIERDLEQRCETVFQKIQSTGCDPFGVEARLRAYHPDFFSTHDAKEAYKNGKIKIEIRNRIINQKNP